MDKSGNDDIEIDFEFCIYDTIESMDIRETSFVFGIPDLLILIARSAKKKFEL